MANIHRCDNCNTIIEGYKDLYIITIEPLLYSREFNRRFSKNTKTNHLCAKCYSKAVKEIKL